MAKKKRAEAQRQAAKARRDQAKAEIRSQALRRYARWNGGRPEMCNGNPGDAQARINSGIYWSRRAKVIFNSVADAEAFAKLIFGLDGKVQTAYPCEFSRHGHAHLTTEDEE